MSIQYHAVGWNRQKRLYDVVMVIGVLLYLVGFIAGSFLLLPNANPITVMIRAFGSAAFILLHVVLCIGPLCRLNSNYLPLLYNRRHLGVMTFFVSFIHFFLVLINYHGFGILNPLVNIFVANPHYGSIAQFPFQVLGVVALFILFVMAATSHDFWLKNLTAPIWKSLHMMVYVAYALLVGHVVLGVMQSELSGVFVGVMALGVALVGGLHLKAAFVGRVSDEPILIGGRDSDGYVNVCRVDEIVDNAAKVVVLSGEKVAVFKYDGCISAISNVCQHQNGPLGEGRVIKGCVTCPWHGYQYRPADGSSPPPFTEKVPTFRVKVSNGDVYVHPMPLDPGTHVEPARY